MLAGPDASERFLKTASLEEYGVLHFAAHAVVDDLHPDRSAIVLAPGGDDDDGLLQIREIVGLDLRNQVVILSACRSASGAVLAGEGVIGLSRGFFQAGARAVAALILGALFAAAAIASLGLRRRHAEGDSSGRAS